MPSVYSATPSLNMFPTSWVLTLHRPAEELNKKNGWDMRIHVDAASGGFVAPFVNPDLKFDFRLKNVNSVSASGHK